MELDRTSRNNFDESASSLGRRATEAAQDLGKRVEGATQQVKERVETVSQDVKRKADDAMSAVGERLTSAAGTIRHTTEMDGPLDSTAQAVAARLEQGGNYLREKNVNDVVSDIAGIIKRHPMQALCLGIGLGLLLGRKKH